MYRGEKYCIEMEVFFPSFLLDAALVGRQGFLTLTNVEETHRPVIPLIRHSVSSDAGGHTSPLSTPHSLILTRSIFYFFFLSLGYLQASSIFPLAVAACCCPLRWTDGRQGKETQGSAAGSFSLELQEA